MAARYGFGDDLAEFCAQLMIAAFDRTNFYAASQASPIAKEIREREPRD